MKVIILAGGQGRRLAPYTVVLPKPLMPVCDAPILEIIIRQLKSYGLTDIVLAIGHLGNLIQTFFGDGKKFGIKITYKLEDKPLGTVGPLPLIDDLDKTFMVMNGDLLTTLNYDNLIEYHHKNKAIATIAVRDAEVDINYGVIKSKGNELCDYIEKPILEYMVSMGIYVFEPEVLKYIPKGKKFDFPELMQLLLKGKKKVALYKSKDFWLDIGRHEDYQKAIEEYEKIKEGLFKK
jgi:NDP-sugar pyrophosphorylase family protein